LAVAMPFFGFRKKKKMGTFCQLTLLGSITLRQPSFKKPDQLIFTAKHLSSTRLSDLHYPYSNHTKAKI
jgi:hypothetical protein